MHDILYVYADKTTSGAQAQVNLFARHGFTGPRDAPLKKAHCLVDLNGNRELRDELLRPGIVPPFPGSVFRVACAAYIGKKGRDRARVLRILAEKGVLVAVLKREPVLYDTEIKRAVFLEEAEAVARSDNGKAQGPKNKGRPPSVRLTLGQWKACLTMWRKHDKTKPDYVTRDVIRSIIADHSTENGLLIDIDGVTRDYMHSTFGARSSDKDIAPPKQLWIEEK